MPRTVKIDKHLHPGSPTKPSNLSERASAEWDRLTGELERAHIQVTAAHRAILSLAATIAADIASSWDAIQEDGMYVVNAKTGIPQEHPAAKRLDALRRDYLKALVMLGLRASVAQPEDKKEETLEDILNG